jgi:cytochrome P450
VAVAELPRSRVPAIVNGVGYALDPIGHIRWFAGRYGAVTAPRFPGMGLIVSIADPDLVRQVFTGDAGTFHSGESSKPVLEPTVGSNSLLTLDDEPHMRHRKLLLGPFHGQNISRWEDAIRSISEQEIASWPVGEPFALHERVRTITLDVILRAVFGVREQARFEEARTLIKEFANRAHPISLFPGMRRDLGPRSPWVRFKHARAELDRFLYAEIERRRVEADLMQRDDVLSLLLRATDEAGAPLSELELRDELVTVLAAGHETTATGVAWAFERLLRTPRVLHRLTRSLQDGNEYLDATIKETLRARPVVTDVGRKLTREIELAGFRLPAGTLVMPAIAAIHFREDLYPEPDEFRPERFLQGTPDAYTWIPFGGGVRRCIGASFAQFEMRVIIRTILERVRLRAANRRPERSKLRNVTAAPAHGCRVVVESMNSAPAAGHNGRRGLAVGDPVAKHAQARQTA